MILAAMIRKLKELTGKRRAGGDAAEVVYEPGAAEQDVGPATWEALVGLLDDPAFGPDSSERVEQDLNEALEEEIRSSTPRAR